MRDVFQVELPLRTLFESPTVAGWTAQIEAARQQYAEQAPPIVPVDHDAPLPLSFAQQRLWILDQLEPGTATYNIPGALRLRGPLDVFALERSLESIVRRHAVLRTTFSQSDSPTDSVAVQTIDEWLSAPLMQLDLRTLPELQREEEASRLILEESQQPFDLAFGPLLRNTLLTLDDHEHVLLLTLHHIITDGWSLSVFVRELLGVRPVTGETQTEFPLRAAIWPFPAMLLLLSYHRHLFDRETIQRMLDNYRILLEGIAARPEQSIGDVLKLIKH